MKSVALILITGAAASLSYGAVAQIAPGGHSTTPASHPAKWISESDFPDDIPHYGVINYKLMVDENGKVSDCIIEESSAPLPLGNAACRALKKRARFIPATDANGAVTPGFYRSRINLGG